MMILSRSLLSYAIKKINAKKVSKSYVFGGFSDEVLRAVEDDLPDVAERHLVDGEGRAGAARGTQRPHVVTSAHRVDQHRAILHKTRKPWILYRIPNSDFSQFKCRENLMGHKRS